MIDDLRRYKSDFVPQIVFIGIGIGINLFSWENTT